MSLLSTESKTVQRRLSRDYVVLYSKRLNSKKKCCENLNSYLCNRGWFHYTWPAVLRQLYSLASARSFHPFSSLLLSLFFSSVIIFLILLWYVLFDFCSSLQFSLLNNYLFFYRLIIRPYNFFVIIYFPLSITSTLSIFLTWLNAFKYIIWISSIAIS